MMDMEYNRTSPFISNCLHYSSEFHPYVGEFLYICNMKKISKNTVFITPVRPTERKFILDSMIASFRIEGIFIPEAKVQAIYARVNEKLKK